MIAVILILKITHSVCHVYSGIKLWITKNLKKLPVYCVAIFDIKEISFYVLFSVPFFSWRFERNNKNNIFICFLRSCCEPENHKNNMIMHIFAFKYHHSKWMGTKEQICKLWWCSGGGNASSDRFFPSSLSIQHNSNSKKKLFNSNWNKNRFIYICFFSVLFLFLQ